jgi:hypothetical protein
VCLDYDWLCVLFALTPLFVSIFIFENRKQLHKLKIWPDCVLNIKCIIGQPQPMQPTQPTQPTQPMQPMQPMQPTQPTHPTQPMQPTNLCGSAIMAMVRMISYLDASSHDAQMTLLHKECRYNIDQVYDQCCKTQEITNADCRCFYANLKALEPVISTDEGPEYTDIHNELIKCFRAVKRVGIANANANASAITPFSSQCPPARANQVPASRCGTPKNTCNTPI